MHSCGPRRGSAAKAPEVARNLCCLRHRLASAGSNMSGVSNMKARESALRVKRFEAQEMARKVADLEYMIREFEQMALDLERQIQTEEERTGIKDPAHFAYSTFAKSAGQRRDNLKASIADLQVKLERAVSERDEAQAELARSQPAEPRDGDRLVRKSDRPAQAALR